MTNEAFNKMLKETLKACEDTLSAKSEDYSRGGDKLHNFRRAAQVGETTPAKALLGMKLKHDISILDIVDDLEYAKVHHEDYIQEKFGDAINYLILLKAIVLEATANA